MKKPEMKIVTRFKKDWANSDIGMGTAVTRAIQALEERIDALASAPKQYELQPDGTFVPLDSKQKIDVTIKTDPLNIESWTDTGKIYAAAIKNRVEEDKEKREQELFEAGWLAAIRTAAYVMNDDFGEKGLVVRNLSFGRHVLDGWAQYKADRKRGRKDVAND